MEQDKGIFAQAALGEKPYRAIKPREPLPAEGQCPVCNGWDVSHPDVKRILTERDPHNRLMLLIMARCKCASVADVAKRNLEMRWQMANLPHSKDKTLTPRTFDNFQALPGTEAMVKAAKNFVDDIPPRILVLAGKPGLGKSHMLEAIGRALLDKGRKVRYEMVSSLLDRLRHTYAEHTESDLFSWLQWYSSQYALLLDDLGMEAGTDWAIEKLTAIIDERLRQGDRTVITTNLGPDALANNLGARLASRLFQANRELNEVKVVVLASSLRDYRSL